MGLHYHPCPRCYVPEGCTVGTCTIVPDLGTYHGDPMGYHIPCNSCTNPRVLGDSRAVLKALVETLPRCSICDDAPATRAYARGGARYCDACPATLAREKQHGPPPDYPRAAALRQALALLGRP